MVVMFQRGYCSKRVEGLFLQVISFENQYQQKVKNKTWGGYTSTPSYFYLLKPTLNATK